MNRRNVTGIAITMWPKLLDHYSCNNLYGSFTISEIAFSDGQLTKLAVDFVQYCESTDNPPLFGILRFNSTAKIL